MGRRNQRLKAAVRSDKFFKLKHEEALPLPGHCHDHGIHGDRKDDALENEDAVENEEKD